MENIKDALFLLVRHGETLLNEEDKFRGWSDDDAAALDEEGVRQAKTAAKFISKLIIKVGLICSSDLNRTEHTAAIIAKRLGIKDILVTPRLRPLNVGVFTGEGKANISIDYYLNNPDEKFPGGESVNGFRARQQSFQEEKLQPWIDAHPGEKAIEVGHLSQVVFWQDKRDALEGYLKDYATDKKDIIHPGGIVAVMPDDRVIPLLGENKHAQESDKGEE